MVRAATADQHPGHQPPNGGYHLLSSIAHGGFARVYRAEHPARPGQLVAFKRPLQEEPLALERMVREVQVQRQFHDAHIMPVLDAADDCSWFVMPLADGNLEGLWESGALGSDAEAVAAEILGAVTRGLEPAHAGGYVHRDITPRNILALPDRAAPSGRRWVVADWGLVRRPPGHTTHRYTRTGEPFGTYGFAAPETYDDGHRAGPEADVYSLGRVIAWLLTGRRPHQNTPLLPEGPLRGLVAESTENDPARRIPTVRAVRDRFSALQTAPSLSPRAAIAEMISQIRAGRAADVGGMFALARQHPSNESLYLDELAGMPSGPLAAYTRSAPQEAAEVATTMMRHLIEGDWGRRDFNYANTPLGFSFTVLRTLIADGYTGLAEDLAVIFFKADEKWYRFSQVNATVAWLKALPEQHGAVIARAVRRSGTAGYYSREIGDDRVTSRSLAAELGL
jgi:eukaryotic-like serine/threonine-protein kinase